MTTHSILNIAKMLNYFPKKQGISSDLIPCSILTVESMGYKNHLTLHPGHYCQVHENKEPSNSDKSRTQGAIYIVPCGNLQGGFKFMGLQTGKNITRYNSYEILIPQTMIDQVNVLGKYQPEHFIFTDKKGHKIGESDIIGVEGDKNVTPQILIE